MHSAQWRGVLTIGGDSVVMTTALVTPTSSCVTTTTINQLKK
jgi:hypothetical protein